MIYPEIPLAQTVIQLCKAKQIKHIVISPGSRNAPLTIGFSNDSYFTCYSIVDERCAAFFAMGIAQHIKAPTAVVCTSGSALLNYYPAIAEAFYSDIPLVILSADRPKHLVGIGDGQTINQKEVFKNHILYSAHLKLDLDTIESQEDDLPIFKNLENKLERLLHLKQSIEATNSTTINRAVNTAISKKGPVHINVPFNEPLYNTVTKTTVFPEVIPPTLQDFTIDEQTIGRCRDIWQRANRKLILIGVNYPNVISEAHLNALAKDPSVIVFTETTSNISHPTFFPSIDKIISPLNKDGLEALQPEVLLTFGGLVVSKKIKAFLRQYKPKHHWHVDVKKANDTFFSLNAFIQTTPNVFLSKLLTQNIQAKSAYQAYWLSVKKDRNVKHEAYLKTAAYSDLTVFNQIFKTLPKASVLQLGNSSTVRYAQLFNIDPSVEVYCNRGTSGIDGSTSTAIGFAVSVPKQTVLITGDISFFYDSNALWNNYIPKNFRIILINNSGGGIFRILPGAKDTETFDTFFETKHSLTAEHLCAMYGFEYLKTSSILDLNTALTSFYNTGNSPKLLEVFTPRTVNDELLINYFKYLL